MVCHTKVVSGARLHRLTLGSLLTWTKTSSHTCSLALTAPETWLKNVCCFLGKHALLVHCDVIFLMWLPPQPIFPFFFFFPGQWPNSLSLSLSRGGGLPKLWTNLVTSITLCGCRVTNYQVSQMPSYGRSNFTFGYVVAHGYMQLVGCGRCMVMLSRVTRKWSCIFMV